MMLRAAVAMFGLVSVGCTTPNPEFGDTGGSTTVQGSEASTLGTTSGATTPPTTTTVDPSATTETTAVPTTDDSSTGEPSRECCGELDCADAVRECMCEYPEALMCCDPPWGSTCADVAVACGGRCDGEVFSCCVSRTEPACTGIALEGSFCLFHSTCCVQQWTPTCVALYDEQTGSCGLEPCDAAHPSPGCDDAAVMECVCNAPEFAPCCTDGWAPACVDAALACG